MYKEGNIGTFIMKKYCFLAMYNLLAQYLLKMHALDTEANVNLV